MTRLEHLKKLPLQKRLQAMENVRKTTSFIGFKGELDWPIDKSKSCIAGCFIWSDTRQGYDYWSHINYKYFGDL